jgi:sulfatase maturation enzyme AslB (radical SAM superfamily)
VGNPRFYAKYSLITLKRIKMFFIYIVNFPLVNFVYNRLYYFLIRQQSSHGLIRIEIEGYNICNLKCIMCPYQNMTRNKVLMNMDLFKKIIDDAAINGGKEIGLNFYNEPFLDPLLFERISYVKGKKIHVYFNSNGSILDNAKIDGILNSGLDSIVFSFDGGTKEIYEKIRVGADFEQTKDNILSLIRERNKRKLKKPNVFINFVVQKDNYNEIKILKDFWGELIDGINISEVDNRLTHALSPAQLKSSGFRRLYPCRRIFQVMNVMSNGKVALCCRDFDGSMRWTPLLGQQGG